MQNPPRTAFGAVTLLRLHKKRQKLTYAHTDKCRKKPSCTAHLRRSHDRSPAFLVAGSAEYAVLEARQKTGDAEKILAKVPPT